MKKVTSTAIAVLVSMFTYLNAQVQQIQLEQTPGEFTTASLTLTPGDYQFTISNNNVGYDEGFVPKEQYASSKHIKDAYVTTPIKTGSSAKTNVVNLPHGEYTMMKKTEDTTTKNGEDTTMTKGEEEVVMKKGEGDTTFKNDKVEPINIRQNPGKSEFQSVMVSDRAYEFETPTISVPKDEGFLLVSLRF